MRGEHAHMILQALCRGRMRKSDGAKCLPMDAYVIASSKYHHRHRHYRHLPWLSGCALETGEEGTVRPGGKAALAFVQAAIDRRETWISFNSISEALVRAQQLPEVGAEEG